MYFLFLPSRIQLAPLCLIHRHGILHNIASDQGTHFTAKEAWEWVHEHWIHWSHHTLHHLEAVSLNEEWNGLVKTQLKLRGNILWGTIFLGHNICFESEHFTWFCVLNKNTWAQEPSVEAGMASLSIITPKNLGGLRSISSSQLCALQGAHLPGNTARILLN